MSEWANEIATTHSSLYLFCKYTSSIPLPDPSLLSGTGSQLLVLHMWLQYLATVSNISVLKNTCPSLQHMCLAPADVMVRLIRAYFIAKSAELHPSHRSLFACSWCRDGSGCTHTSSMSTLCSGGQGAGGKSTGKLYPCGTAEHAEGRRGSLVILRQTFNNRKGLILCLEGGAPCSRASPEAVMSVHAWEELL